MLVPLPLATRLARCARYTPFSTTVPQTLDDRPPTPYIHTRKPIYRPFGWATAIRRAARPDQALNSSCLPEGGPRRQARGGKGWQLQSPRLGAGGATPRANTNEAATHAARYPWWLVADKKCPMRSPHARPLKTYKSPFPADDPQGPALPWGSRPKSTTSWALDCLPKPTSLRLASCSSSAVQREVVQRPLGSATQNGDSRESFFESPGSRTAPGAKKGSLRNNHQEHFKKLRQGHTLATLEEEVTRTSDATPPLQLYVCQFLILWITNKWNGGMEERGSCYYYYYYPTKLG